MNLEALNEAIATFHRGKKWILVPDAAAGATPLVDSLREWGVDDMMIVSAIEGVGDVPQVKRLFYTRALGDTVMKGVRASLAALEQPSDALLSAVDDFDPDGEALVLGAGFSREPVLAGRPVYGARPASWGALEDKMIVDRLWDEAGVARAPSAVVPVPGAADAARRLVSEMGTVWVADNSEGWHGGGEYARWVRNDADARTATAWFARHAAMVRVMPFLDGIPCSIHGFVTEDGVAVFLPVEMIILRDLDRPAFVYAQAANFWDPPQGVRDQMREAARSVGELLDTRYEYRGGYGIDGVCTDRGFMPTELNPRLSVGHGLQARAADVPLGSMERMIVNHDLEFPAQDLEETIVAAVCARRGGGMLVPLTAIHEPAKTGIQFISDGAVAVDPDGECDGTMEIGAASMGSIIMMRLDPDRTPVGPSTAPRAIQAIDLARDLWGVELPSLQAAPDLR